MIRLVDTSVAVKWFVSEDGEDAARRLIGEPLLAPDLLLIEASTVAVTRWKKNEISREQADIVPSLVASIVDLTPSMPLAERALQIALELRHPVYDCYYLAMCEATGAPMITADKRLIERCRDTAFFEMLIALELA